MHTRRPSHLPRLQRDRAPLPKLNHAPSRHGRHQSWPLSLHQEEYIMDHSGNTGQELAIQHIRARRRKLTANDASTLGDSGHARHLDTRRFPHPGHRTGTQTSFCVLLKILLLWLALEFFVGRGSSPPHQFNTNITTTPFPSTDFPSSCPATFNARCLPIDTLTFLFWPNLYNVIGLDSPTYWSSKHEYHNPENFQKVVTTSCKRLRKVWHPDKTGYYTRGMCFFSRKLRVTCCRVSYVHFAWRTKHAIVF